VPLWGYRNYVDDDDDDEEDINTLFSISLTD
jgi:hypothetical protein